MDSATTTVDIAIEVARVLLVGSTLLYLWYTGQKAGLRTQAGWYETLIGLSLFLCGMLLDISNNFPALNEYRLIGKTIYAVYLGKLLGYLLGVLFIIRGLRKWITALVQLKQAQSELQTLRQKLEQEVVTRTAALRQSEAELQTILDAVPALIFYKDRENNFVRVNKTFAEVVGLSREKIEGHVNTKVYPRQAQEYWADDKEVMASGEPKFNIIESQGTGAEKKWLQTNKTPYRNEDNEVIGIIGFSLDITEQRKTEARLQKRAAQLALLNDIGEQIAAVLDLESLLSRTVRLAHENFDYHHVAIFTPSKNQQKLVMRAQSGEYATYPAGHSLKLGQGMVGWAGKQNEMLLANNVRNEPHYVNLYPDRIPTQSELCVPIRANGEANGVLDVQSPHLNAFDAEDVMALRTLAAQLSVALKNAALHTETRQRAERLTLINRISHTANAQLELDELLETVYHEITATFDYDAFFIALYDQEREELDYRINIDRGVRREKEQGCCFPLSNNLPSHVVRTRTPLLINTQPEKQLLPGEPDLCGRVENPPSWLGVPLLSGPQVLGVICVQASRPQFYQEHDLELLTTIANELAGAVKNAQLYGELAASNRQLTATLTELRAAEEELVQQERLAVVGQLAGGIAHEYNNFMASIILYSQMMLRTSPLAATDREKITAILSEARAAADLTQQILDFGREAMLRLEELEVCPFLHEITQRLDQQLAPNIELHVTCQLPRPATIHVDRDRLRQAILNLADNSRLAMPEGGELSLSITAAENPPSSSTPGENTWIELTVTDTGIGMSEEVLDHLFEPFFTTRRPLGSGLGLAQVYGTVNQHGGQVKVKSVEQEGTTVTISLPAQFEEE